MDIIKRLWSEDELEYEGKYYTVPRTQLITRPVQQPHPPIIMGGDGATTFDRVVEYCDGWMPVGSGAPGGPSMAEKIALLKRQASEAGRDPASISISSFGTQPDPDIIRGMEAAGVERVVFSLPSVEREEVLPLIDEYAKLI
jgi:alkanesulfonate monooxygenase SsuD/methylene tetrahydromethanopterin reductase-like flavin-dependent oxidoreductase (luciferase family)